MCCLQIKWSKYCNLYLNAHFTAYPVITSKTAIKYFTISHQGSWIHLLKSNIIHLASNEQPLVRQNLTAGSVSWCSRTS